jgi:hypothetical protein
MKRNMTVWVARREDCNKKKYQLCQIWSICYQKWYSKFSLHPHCLYSHRHVTHKSHTFKLLPKHSANIMMAMRRKRRKMTATKNHELTSRPSYVMGPKQFAPCCLNHFMCPSFQYLALPRLLYYRKWKSKY